MATQTTRLKLPTRVDADAFTIGADLSELATKLDVAAIYDQGAFASRPTSTTAQPGIRGRFYYATDQKLLYQDTGTDWVLYAQRPDFVASLPSSPLDGQEIHYQTPDGVQAWQLRYNAAIQDTSRWQFVGGAPIVAQSFTAASASFASATWGPIGTPLEWIATAGGVYDVVAHVSIGCPVAATIYQGLSVAGGSPDNFTVYEYRGAGYATTNLALRARVSCVAGNLIRQVFKHNAGQTVTIDRGGAHLAITPVRLG
jgi:hypothetical protein